MKNKKLIILPLLFIISNVLYIGCCKCNKKEVYPFFDITKVFVSLKGSNNAIVDTGQITTVDSLYINNDFYRDCIAKKINKLAFLGNEAIALSCNCGSCGGNGLKNKIDSITITSDSVYNNVVANTSLNSFFKVKQVNTYNSFDAYKNQINTTIYALPVGQFVTTTKPNNTKGHVFKVAIKFADGKILTANTKRIYWQ
jgi:hypothetical protein